MKYIIILAFMLVNFTTFAQNVRKDTKGNYIAISSQKQAKTEAKNTGKTYTDTKGNSYPVFVTAKGKLFVNRVSKKTGKEYKQYLKTE